MAKRFSPEFKQQAIDYALSNSHESIAASRFRKRSQTIQGGQ